MNRKLVISIAFSFFLFAFLVLANPDILQRVPGACDDSDANCNVANLQTQDSTGESVNLKVSPFAWINTSQFNGSIPVGSTLNNISIHVRWGDSPTGKGAGQQNISIYNTTNWIKCAGPFGDTATWVDTYCNFFGSNLTGNFTTLSALNNITVNFTGVDTNGGAAATALVDIINITVDFTPPSTQFLVMMPSQYTGANYNFTITALSEATANATSWISFNFSTILPQYFVQPSTLGNFSNNQSGNSVPIFLIDNIGTVGINVSLRMNETVTGFEVGANATCTGCTSTITTLTPLTSSYLTLINNLSTTGLGNISLWANATSGAPGGQTTANIIIRSTNATV